GAEPERALPCIGVRAARARTVFPDRRLVADIVVVRLAAEIHRRDLLELRERVLRGDVVRARHRERRVAAELADVPRQVLARVAALDDAVLPAHLQHLGRDPRRAGMRVRAEVADAGMDMELALRRDSHDTVETGEAGRMKALPNGDGPHLRAVALAAPRLALRVVERLGALVERLADIAARHRRTLAADPAVHVGRVEAPHLERIDAELPGGLVEQRLDDRDGLVVARASLGGARHGIREDARPAPAHRLRLVEDRDGLARRRPIRKARRRAALLHDVHIDGNDAAFGVEAHLDAALEAAARIAEIELLGAADAHHHRP